MEIHGEDCNFDDILRRTLKTPNIPFDDVAESRFLPLFQSEQLQEEDHTVFQSLLGMMKNVQTTSLRTIDWWQFVKNCAESANCSVADLCDIYPRNFKCDGQEQLNTVRQLVTPRSQP